MSIPVTGLRPKKLKSAASTPSRGQFFQALPYLTPGTLGLVIFILGPLIASLFISFTVWPMGGSPEFVGLQNYARMIQDPVFWRVMFNTTLFAILFTAINWRNAPCSRQGHPRTDPCHRKCDRRLYWPSRHRYSRSCRWYRSCGELRR